MPRVARSLLAALAVSACSGDASRLANGSTPYPLPELQPRLGPWIQPPTVRTLDASSTPALASATMQRDASRIEGRWQLVDLPSRAPSPLPAPSWHALCDGALGCVRTGPWTDMPGWLRSVHRSHARTWETSWPGALAGALDDVRARVPPIAQPFFDQALRGLAEVEFAGARLEPDGTGLAFVRVPAPWVEFTAGLLSHAGSAPRTIALATGTEVSWAPLGPGGVLLALDEGPDPRLGWVVWATNPERFSWLLDAPRTRAGPPGAAVHVERVGTALRWAPVDLKRMLQPWADRSATIRVDWKGGGLVARGALDRSFDGT